MAVSLGEGVTARAGHIASGNESASASLAGGKSSVKIGETVDTAAGGESVSANVYGFIALLLIVAVIFFIWASKTGGGQLNTPRYENAPEGLVSAGLTALTKVPGDLGDMATGHEWKLPDWDTLPLVKSRHRYPTQTGLNGSALIHKGWQPMMRPAEQDADWMEVPPTEVTIGGYDGCGNHHDGS